MFRRLLVATVAALALVATALALPAAARPSSVGPPWVKASGPTSLTVDWNPAKGARTYQVFYSTTYAGAMATSAKSRTTSSSQVTLTGLKPGRMYCVTVRGLAGSSKGSRSARHCKLTMRRANDTRLRTARVATFNICSNAGSPAYCPAFTPTRINAVAQRIAATKADVVALQEASQKFDEVARAVAPQGFAVASKHGSEAILYRTAAFEPVTEVVEPEEPQDPDVDEEEDPVEPPVETVALEGSFDLTNSADAAWARLRLRSNGVEYMVVSAHLTAGKSSTSAAKRKVETQSLVRQLAATRFPAQRIVIAGDLNSHRNRASDTPRAVLNAAGWHDTYDRSATFTSPRYNSYTGWSTAPSTSNTYGDHVDHVFVKDTVGSTTWRVQQSFRNGRYATPVPSDHSPVRVTLYLP